MIDPTEGGMLATPTIGASLQMKAIIEYLNREDDKANPVAREDYKRIGNEPRSMIGLDILISSIYSLAGKRLPPSKISQGLIKRAHTDAVRRFELAGIPL